MTEIQQPNKRLPLWARALRVLLIAYFGVILIGAGCQTWLVFPGHRTQGLKEAMVQPQPAAGVEVVNLKAAGEDVKAVWLEATRRPSATRPAGEYVVLYFYGNGSCASYVMDDLGVARDMGCDVLVPDYVGYGMSSGKPSEAACYATADAAYQYLVNVRHVPPDHIIIAGQSLGGAVAIDLASRQPSAGLMTLSTFTTLPEVGRCWFPWLPVARMLDSHFDNVSKINKVKAPILIVHGDADHVVPCRMAPLLEAACTASWVRRVQVAGGGHNNLFYEDPAKMKSALADFLAAVRANASVAVKGK